MSGDALCVGVCMMDWESGVCLGCGRTADEIYGTTETSEAEPPAESQAGLPASEDAPAPGAAGQAGKDEA